MRTLPAIVVVAGLGAACSPYSRPADFLGDTGDPLWSADVEPVGDDLYVRLPAARQLARVEADGTTSTVDLDGATPERLVATPDESALLVFARWPVCEDPDPKIELYGDCPEEPTIQRELAWVAGNQRQRAFDVPPHLNALTFSNDGRFAVAYLENGTGLDIEVDGLIDPGEVMFIPLDGAGDPRSISVGFTPESVLFAGGSDGQDDRAVVFSRSEVVVVELETLATVVTYPLVLDADQVVDPRDAVLTQDGRIALVAIEGSEDLYVLDLEQYSIDIEELDATPSRMVNAVLPGAAEGGGDLDVTLVAYSGQNQVDRIDQSTLELMEPWQLEQGTNEMLVTASSALLYNTARSSAKDVYRVDLATNEIVEYRVANPMVSLQLGPAERYAVGVLEPENSTGGTEVDRYQDDRWGMAVLDLASEDATSLVLESEPRGIALVQQDEATFALVLMEGRDALLKVDLAQPTFYEEVELEAPPIGIGALSSGSFYVTHESALGLITFIDPTGGTTGVASGFATPGLLSEPILPRRDQN